MQIEPFRHEVVTPSGEVYLEVWRDNGKLQMLLKTGFVVHLDEKVIPQLAEILQTMKDES